MAESLNLVCTRSCKSLLCICKCNICLIVRIFPPSNPGIEGHNERGSQGGKDCESHARVGTNRVDPFGFREAARQKSDFPRIVECSPNGYIEDSIPPSKPHGQQPCPCGELEGPKCEHKSNCNDKDEKCFRFCALDTKHFSSFPPKT